MRVLLLPLPALLLVLPLPAASQSLLPPSDSDGPYVGLSAGFLVLSDVNGEVGGVDVEAKYDDGFAIGGQLGYKHSVLRAELELEYARAGFDSISALGMTGDVDGNFDILRGTASLYYDFDNLTRFTPYMGGGLGAAYVDVEDGTVAGVDFEGGSDTYFTAHGEVGLAIEATDRFAIVPAYRFIWLDDAEDGFDDDTAHLFKVGLRFRL